MASVPAASAPLPHIVNDPVASLAMWPVTVRFGGLVVDIPPMPASDWLSVLMQSPLELWDIIPGLCPDREEDIKDALLLGDIAVKEFRDLCFEVIAVASGRSWWFTLQLIQTVRASWEVLGGRLAYRQIDASKMPLGMWLDAALIVCLESMKPEQTTMFLSQLQMPPPGAEVPKEVLDAQIPEMSKSTFMAMR